LKGYPDQKTQTYAGKYEFAQAFMMSRPARLIISPPRNLIHHLMRLCMLKAFAL
jgi:hypothetical protein